jgi:hypothetical protein
MAPVAPVELPDFRPEHIDLAGGHSDGLTFELFDAQTEERVRD